MPFDDRKNANEKKFEMDQQSLFKIEARASKLIGAWAAEKLGLSGDDIGLYAKEVVIANLDEPGYDDVKRKLQGDFSTRDIEVPEHEIDHAIAKYVVLATEQVAKESEK
ncbi:MAG: DUF1476 domain-containing protein [Alphaproteobacteria bacterium]|nr:DUF1476 domain-containing protein [Alphaproteobacteria bacterium]MCB1551397.1 DUF1476 domain-containing protein [Alphaproteobacteria bacterium]MCB9984288.1 DUF1476 domain-containing protein [Micavibrio sp.]HPQ50443.1 DUF1476 domain-containing protein [Alphaproteobacteria bacterium]